MNSKKVSLYDWIVFGLAPASREDIGKEFAHVIREIRCFFHYRSPPGITKAAIAFVSSIISGNMSCVSLT
jgi:hypothetical protein